MAHLLRVAMSWLLLTRSMRLGASSRVEGERLESDSDGNLTLAAMPETWLEYVEVAKDFTGKAALEVFGVADYFRSHLEKDVMLGVGGFGTVTSVNIKADPALKGALKRQQFTPDRYDLVRAEVAMMTTRWNRILPLFACGPGGDDYYYTITPEASGTLRDPSKLRGYEDKDAERIRAFILTFFDLVHAVDNMHHFDLVHRDIKPDNVFYFCHPDYPNMRCNAVLGDFGCACRLDPSSQSMKNMPVCDPAVLTGTLDYLPADMQTKGSQTLGKLKPADMYAIGLTMHHSMGEPYRGAEGPWNDMNERFGRGFGDQLASLIFGLQNSDARKRPTAASALATLRGLAQRLGLGNLDYPLRFGSESHTREREHALSMLRFLSILPPPA